MPKKYNRDKEFDIRKMVKLVNKRSELMSAYLDLYGKYKDKLNYHYNEFILSFMFLFMVEKSKKLQDEYDSLKVIESDPTKVLSEDSSPVEDSQDMEIIEKCISESKALTSEDKDRFYNMVKKEVNKYIKETTTSASSGAYSTPFSWSKTGLADMKPIYRGGTKVKVKESKTKTPSEVNASSIGKANKDNMVSDFSSHSSFKDAFKDGAYDKYLDYDKDSLKPEDAKARRATDEESDEIYKKRGAGLETVEIDLPSEEWEKRRDADLGEDFAKKAKEKREYRKSEKEAGYPKVSVPVTIDEGFGRLIADIESALARKPI